MPDSYLQRAIDYIERNLADAPSADEVACATGFPQSSCARRSCSSAG